MKNPRITQEEVGIIKKAQAGDMLAFNKLFKKYKGFVDNVIFQYIKDMDESKDITNIVFLKVYDKLSTFTDYSSFGGWLRIIAKNTAIDYLRRMKDKSMVLGDNSERLSLESISGSVEGDVVNHMAYDQLLAEFEKLPETTRKVCKLFYENNMTVQKISKKLCIPTGTIKSMLFRTRRRLKQQFKIS